MTAGELSVRFFLFLWLLLLIATLFKRLLHEQTREGSVRQSADAWVKSDLWINLVDKIRLFEIVEIREGIGG